MRRRLRTRPRRVHRQLRPGERGGRQRGRHPPRPSRSSTCGPATPTQARAPVGAGHDRQRVLDHQDHGGHLRADARRPRRGRPRRAGGRRYWPEFARQRQGGRARPPRDEPHRRAVGLRAGHRGRATSTTGTTSSPASPRRRRGGSRAPRRATTRSPRATCRASSCAGSPAASIGTFFREEVAEPLGADFHIGLPASEDHRVADLVPPDLRRLGAGAVDPDSLGGPHACSAARSTPPSPAPARGVAPRSPPPAAPATPARSAASTRRWPAAARSTASGSCPRPASSASSRSRSTAPTSCSACPMRFGMGFGLMSDAIPLSPNPRAFFWGGWGGSIALIDLDAADVGRLRHEPHGRRPGRRRPRRHWSRSRRSAWPTPSTPESAYAARSWSDDGSGPTASSIDTMGTMSKSRNSV